MIELSQRSLVSTSSFTHLLGVVEDDIALQQNDARRE